MSLDLIHQLGTILRRPLDQLPEERFQRHAHAKNDRYGTNQDRITHDAYCLADDGTIIGLFLAPVTSHILLNFPFQNFRDLKYLYLSRVNLSSFEWLRNLTSLTTLDLRNNSISDGAFLKDLKGLTALDLRNNRINNGAFLTERKRALPDRI
jgi:Leucine-rich repeat (LRR) protein